MNATDTADVLAAHQVESRGATASTPDRCTCGEAVHPAPDPTTEGPAVPIEGRRRRAFAAHQARALAAARAETTTATVEDTARAIHRALAPRWMSVAQALGPDQDAYEAMLADIAKSLADAGPLATARTRPTREELAEAIMDSDTIPCDVCDDSRCHYCRSDALRKADAVLVLYADQPTEAEAGARALEQAAEWLRSDMDEPWGDRAANRLYVRAARIRAGGAR